MLNLGSPEKQNIKVSFSQKSMRFRMRLSKAIVDQHESLPKDILLKIKMKLESLVKSKQAIEYEIFDQKLVEVWQHFKENDLSSDTEVEFSIAQAVPPLQGVSLKSSSNPKYVCKISIAKDSPVEIWEADWLITYINRKMIRAKLPGQINNAQVTACLARAKRGDVISNFGLIPEQKHQKTDLEVKPIAISISKIRKELCLVINKKDALIGLTHEDVLKYVKSAADKLEKFQSLPIYIEEESLKEKIEHMKVGPESFGIGLPRSILAGFGSEDKPKEDLIDDSQLIDGEKIDISMKQKRALDRLYLRVSEDRMSCEIVNFDRQVYQHEKFECSKEWLLKQLKRFKIVEEAYEPHIEQVLKLMKMEEDLNKVVVASGIVGKAAEGAYIYEVYKTAKQEAAAETDDTIDFRDLHQTDIVKEDTLIAEIRYMTPEEPSITVHGKKVAGPAPEKFKIHLGEGIEERKKGQFWSIDYGVPQIKGNKIDLLKALVHIGDVNMKSGNIIFDGPVEIRGDIDLGATVEATNDIKIIGNIEGAVVRSLKGSVIVHGGVITTERGKVEARVDVKATFVENSHIIAGQKLIVEKAILNSTVHVGDIVRVYKSSGGMIAGGKIYAGKIISTPNLGFQRGHVTYVNCGGDWKTEYSMSINLNRLNYLKEDLTKSRSDLREISRKKYQDKEEREKKKILQERVKKLKRITEALEHKMNVLKAKVTYNDNAEIFVYDMLYMNCQISISSKPVKVNFEFKEVVITPKKEK